MNFLSYLSLGNLYSEFFNGLQYICSLSYTDVYQFLFNGLELTMASGILDEYAIVVDYTFKIPEIPILSDILGGMFTLLFFDGRFDQMPFYFSFGVCMIRITLMVLIIDICQKIFGVVRNLIPL